MPEDATTLARTVCGNCGFEAPAAEWGSVEHPTLGRLTQCPDCGSTDVRTAG
jgi:predicted RNA-binding Zn-ribbon protein involved in translation (DUF1610 family)